MYKNIASALFNVIDVGSVDADAQLQLKKRFNLQSYPSIFFFQGNNFTEYEGDRDSDDIIDAGFFELRKKVDRNIDLNRNSRNIKIDDSKCFE
jgi:hypothetical protein